MSDSIWQLVARHDHLHLHKDDDDADDDDNVFGSAICLLLYRLPPMYCVVIFQFKLIKCQRRRQATSQTRR